MGMSTNTYLSTRLISVFAVFQPLHNCSADREVAHMAGPMLAAPHLFQHHHHLNLAESNSQASPADSQKSDGAKSSGPTDTTSEVSDPSPTGQSCWLSDTEQSEPKDNFYHQFATRNPYQGGTTAPSVSNKTDNLESNDEVVTCPDCGLLLLNHQYFQRHLEECHNAQERPVS